MNGPDIYTYLDFRKFLSDWFDAKKAKNPRYSHRVFVRQTGQKSPSFLGDVIKRRRNLTTDTASAFCSVIKFGRGERRFFLLLVDFQQADNDAEKQEAWEQIAATKRFREGRKLEGEAFEILSNWEYSAVHQLARRPDFRLDPVWISKMISPSISPKTARRVVEVLFAAGLLVRDARGSLTCVDCDLVTPEVVQGLAVRNYHRGMLELARSAVDNCHADRYHYQGITVGISNARLPALRTKIREVTAELAAFCETSGGSVE